MEKPLTRKQFSPHLDKHRISPDQLAKCDETHLLSAIPESDHQLCLVHPSDVEVLSTDNQCLGCRIWYPLLSVAHSWTTSFGFGLLWWQ